MSAADLWEQLCSYSDTYTCYSAAMATWAAYGGAAWARTVDPGLWLTVDERGGGLFGFGHFPPDLRERLGIARATGESQEQALAGVLAELEHSGRVIVAGDGFRLPWHVALGRRHAPHWFVVARPRNELTVIDPFACRNELGVQEAHRRTVSDFELAELLEGLPGDDPVLSLRESLSLGDDAAVPAGVPYQWFVARSADGPRSLSGARGPDAVSLLAAHFRERGQDPEAYRQADDIWSIAQHRAFHHRFAESCGDDALTQWAVEHGAQLVRRWSHMAPLMMQATLALAAGREASGSVAATLEQLAELERAAASAHPSAAGIASDRPLAALPSAHDRRHGGRHQGGV